MKKLYHKSGNGFKIFFFCLALLLINNLSLATTPQENYIPERIILNLTENPATSQAVTWRTGDDVSTPQAQVAPAIGSPDLSKKAKTVNAITEIVKLDNEKIVHSYSVVFKSLKPNTLYAYRVGDGEHWSEWSQFKTACDTLEPFKFVYFGDPQNDIKSICSRIFRAAYNKAPDASFWLFAGDIVTHGDNDEEWAELYYAFGWISRMTPMILLPGNHEYLTKIVRKAVVQKLGHLWRPQFTLPENGPEDLEETVYFIDYQGVRFVMLNGNEKTEEQAKWLDNILAEKPQRWTIVAIHQPLYSTARNRDNPYLRKLFIPIFDKYSVDLVLQGHDHTYGRTYKLRNGIKLDDNEKGTVYVVSVSGPKAYSVDQRYEDIMVKIGAGRQLFQVISVDKNRLLYESFTAIGELYDSFELKK